MKRLNKKGFTLVELVVATAILSVVALVLGMMMTTGTNLYSGVHKKSNLLFKSQVAAAQLEENIVDVSDGMGIDGTTLYIVDKNNLKVKVFYLDSGNDRMMMREDEIEVTVTGSTQTASIKTVGDAVPFCYNISSVEYSPFSDKVDGIDYAYALRFVLTVTKDELNYGKNELLSLRNKPVFVSGADAETDLLSILWRNDG